PLIEGIDAERLLGGKACDTDAIVTHCEESGTGIVIPSKRNRKAPREHDKELYRLRHLVENAFLALKRWRGIAARYAKNVSSFLAAVHIRCLAIWASVL
ncbi:MAG: transposase, partial [Mariprofundaceae bacterium]